MVIKIPRNVHIVYNEYQGVYGVNFRNKHSMDSAEPERFENADQVIDYLRHNQEIGLGERKVNLIVSEDAPDYDGFEGLIRTVKKLSVKRSDKK